MVGGKFPDYVRANGIHLVELVQVFYVPVPQHFHEFHKNFCRCPCVVHGPVMVFQRNIQRLGYGIQLKPVQIGEQVAGHGHRVQHRRRKFHPLFPGLMGNKPHIKRGIMGHQGTILAKCQKPGQSRVNFRCRQHHVVIDPCQLLYVERDGHIRVYKGTKLLRNSPFHHLYRADFDNMVFFRAKPGSLDVKHHIGTGKALPPGIFHQLFLVVHQVPFYPVEDFKIILFVQGMAGVGKSLDTSMVGHGDCRHPPGLRPLYQVFDLGNPVHIAHFRMAVEFYPFYRAVVHPFCGEILGFLNPPHRTDGQFAVEPVYGGHPLQADKAPRGHSLVHVLQGTLIRKHFYRNGIRKIG